MKLPSPRHDDATPGWQDGRMKRTGNTIMHFDFEGFGERNAIRSALAGDAPVGFDRAEVLRLLRKVPRFRLWRAPVGPKQARAA